MKAPHHLAKSVWAPPPLHALLQHLTWLLTWPADQLAHLVSARLPGAQSAAEHVLTTLWRAVFTRGVIRHILLGPEVAGPG